MQKWFYTVDPCLPDFAEERQKRTNIQNKPLPPISAKVSEYNSDVWSEKLERFVTEGICEKIGVAELTKHGFLKVTLPLKAVIISGVQHDFENIKLAPEPEAGQR